MPGHLELCYEIDGQDYWECSLKGSGTNCRINGVYYTQEELKKRSSSWSTWYHTHNAHFTKEHLTSILSAMGPGPDSTWDTYTRRHLEEILELFPPSSGPPDIASQCRDASTQTTSTSGMDTSHPLEIKHEESDDLIAKVLANMQAKMEAIKGHKKLVAEVKNLRELLAEKEAALVESEGVLELEVGQVKAD